jgi:imidazoleglycerol phosphate synthase glutamine amidotransferase subunit HisH
MYAMVIGGVDIVLGAQWLASIGTIRLNLQNKFLRFYENGKKKKFHGINNLPTQIVSSNKMKKMIQKGAQAYFLHCYSMEGMYDETKYLEGLDKMLEKYNYSLLKLTLWPSPNIVKGSYHRAHS